jgi:tripartite-type tricarboxylate transporter receptor subunit TctC
MNESSRYILLAPAMTPKPVMERLQTTLANFLTDATVQQTYINGGFEPGQSNPAQVGAMIQEQYDVWGPFVKELKLKQ